MASLALFLGTRAQYMVSSLSVAAFRTPPTPSIASAISFEVSRPVDPERFNAWITQLLAQKGQDLLRTKGILHYANEDRRFAFQAVHMIADGDFISEWKDGDPRTSRIVFIGRNLNRPKLRRGFESCAAD